MVGTANEDLMNGPSGDDRMFGFSEMTYWLVLEADDNTDEWWYRR